MPGVLPSAEEHGPLLVRHARQILELRAYIAKLVLANNKTKGQLSQLSEQNASMTAHIQHLGAELEKTTKTALRYGNVMMNLHSSIRALNDHNQELQRTNARLQAQLSDLGIVVPDLPELDEAAMPPWDGPPATATEAPIPDAQFDEFFRSL